jgi:hypothetical protein
MERVTQVTREGQEFVEEPIYEVVGVPKAVASSLAVAFGRKPSPTIVDITGYERVRLRWMKPGPDGKLVPK